jgi:hypothetical protein
MKNLLLTAAVCMALAAASVGQTLPAYLPTDGLLGWWPFNGNANDESGNGNNGTLNGATLTTDRFGNASNAFSFDGINDYLTANIDSQSAITVSLWYNSSNPINWYPRLIGIDNIEFLVFAGNNPNYIAANSVGQLISYPGYITTLPFIPNINDWHHVTVTHDHNTGDRKLYIDNELRAIGETIEYLNIPFGNIVFGNTISGTSGDGGAGYIGKIDDIAIYNRALTSEEITSLYTGETVNPPTACNPLPSNLQNGLVGYWPFCGNANDESSNSNNGVINGATLTQDRFGNFNSAYDFNGLNQFIEVTNSPELQFTNTFSISCWCKIVDYSQNENLSWKRRTMVSKPRAQSGPGYFIYALNNASINYGGGLQNSYPDGYEVMASDSLELNEWTHLTISYDGLELLLYKNGVLIDQQVSYLYLDQANTPLFFGKELFFEPESSGWFKGSLDDIALYNRALTPDEVQQLYTLNACTFTIYDTVTVTQTVYDTVSVSVSTTDTLIINTLITSVEPAQENTFLVYPNPAGSQITINNGNVGILGGYTMRITNSAGQEVYNQNITQSEVTLDLGSWGGNGLYVLYIVDPQGEIIAVKQIVLQ